MAAFEAFLALVEGLPHGAHVDEVDEEVVGQLAGAVGEDAVVVVSHVDADGAHAAEQRGHLRYAEVEHEGAVYHQVLGRDGGGLGLHVVAEGVVPRLQVGDGIHLGHFLGGVGAARSERHGDVVPGRLGRHLDPDTTAQHDHVRQGDVGVRGVFDLLEFVDHLEHAGALVDVPAGLRFEPDARTVGAAAVVGLAVSAGRGPGGAHQLLGGEAGVGDLLLEGGDLLVVDQRPLVLRYRVLPDELFVRHLRAEITGARAHVAMQQLVPGAGELVGELVRVLVEVLGDLQVGGIGDHRHVGGVHHRRVLLAFHVGVGYPVALLDLDRLPLVGAGGRFLHFPLVGEDGVEVGVVPLGRGRGPGAFEAGGHGVLAEAGLIGVGPAEALLVDLRALRRFAHGIR